MSHHTGSSSPPPDKGTGGVTYDESTGTVNYRFTAEQAEALKATRARFTPEQLAESKRRGHKSQKLIARLAATETLEEQERLADELCPRFDNWIRGRNRIQSTPARSMHPLRVAGIIRPREREHQPRATRRSASSSSTSGQDPSDPESEPPRRRGELRHVSVALTAALGAIEGTR